MRNSYFPNWSFKLCALILGPALLLGHVFAADTAGRKVKRQVAPQYPALAKQFNATGVVKLSIEVTPSGDVRNVKALGGNPLLIPAAQDAVKQWKYEPAKESSTETVEFKFVGNQ